MPFRGPRAVRWASLPILLVALPAHALDPDRAVTQYVHDTWFAKNGLPQNSVHAIVQTRDGYLWFGTEEGLTRFDGVRFTVFDRGNTPAIRSNYIPCLLETRDGSLWVGTLGGGVVRMKDGRFTRYGVEEGLTSDMVRALYEDTDGTLWIGTVGGGLNWLRDGRFGALTTRDGLSHDFVRGIVPDGAGGLWLATAGGANHVRSGRIDAVFGTRQGLSHDVVMSVYRDRRGRIWLCTQGGLDLLENGRVISFGRAHGLPDPAIFTAYEDRDGNLWVGGEGGLSRYRNGRFTSFTEAHGLSGNRVRSIREDREGNLWVGSFGGGLNRLRDGKLITFTRREGLPHDAIGPVFQDRQGTIWLGMLGGGLSRYAGGRFTSFGTADGLPGNIIESIHQSRDGTLWIGTFGRGLARYREGRFTTLNKSHGLSHDVVMCIREGPDGTLWIGTNGGGLNRYRNGQFTHYRMRDGLAHDLIRDLHFDRTGALWISTFGGGLGRLENGVFSKFTRRDGLSSDVVGQIHEEADGTLWITTLGGGLMRRKDGRFVAITSRQGLHDDGIYALVDDGMGHFWMSCNNGVFRVAKADLDAVADGRRARLECLAFGESDGMRNRECNGSSPASLLSRDGRLWFPTLEGMAVLDPTHIPTNQVPPPVRIERLVVNGNTVAPAAGLRIAPGARKLKVHYTALSFSVPSRVRFRFRLEGFEEKWVEADESRTAYYTNLPPGDYRFRVIACNDDGLWNESGASLHFRLEPFYYQTWWFAALLILSALAIGVMAHKLRVRRLTARARTLKGLVEERTRAQEALTVSNRQLEDALESLRRAQATLVEQERLRALGQMASGITHDFNNALSPILGFTDLLLRRPELLADREKARAYLKTVQTAATDAGHMVSRLREFYRARDLEETLPLVDVNAVVEQAVSLTQPRWKDQALADNLTVTVGVELQEVPLVPANASDLREALTNLIFNAVDALPQGGTITLATRCDGEHLVIEVRDDGLGMSDEVRRRCLEPFFTTKGEQGTGLGLPMIYGIVQRHAATLEIDTAPGRGTAIAIRLPVGGGAAADSVLDGDALDVDPLDVLVVDDEPAIVEFLSTALRGDGHRVETAKDGMEALLRIKHRAFDLIVTDRAMPRMAGDQLAAAVRLARPATRIILLTGFGEIMLAQSQAPDGVDQILSKPVTVTALRSALAALFGPSRDQERRRTA
jgi:ligand-binding sensor domain-containing protein/signal transduction histidine kinase/CheY-like chemotaxis protein